MELVINEMNIFDKNCSTKLNEVIVDNRNMFQDDAIYEVTINYNVEFTYNMELWNFDDSVFNEINEFKSYEDRVYKALSKQIHAFSGVLEKNKIAFTHLSSEGLNGEKDAIVIKFDVRKDNDKIYYCGTGKNKKILKCLTIVPDRSFVMSTLEKEYPRFLYDGFQKVYDVVPDWEIIAEALGLKKNAKQGVIIQEFFRQYGDIVLCSKERWMEIGYDFLQKVCDVSERRKKKDS